MIVPPAPPQYHGHTKHSPKTVLLAKTMYDGGWTPTQIRRYIGGLGLTVPAESTIRRWCIPAEAAAAAQAAKLCNRRRRAVRARIIELRFEVRLSAAAIVRLVRHDHGKEASWVNLDSVNRIVAEHESGPTDESRFG